MSDPKPGTQTPRTPPKGQLPPSPQGMGSQSGCLVPFALLIGALSMALSGMAWLAGRFQ